MSLNHKAQVLTVTPKGVTVSILTGPHRKNCYGNLPPRDDVAEGQFVEVFVHPNGQQANWPTSG